MTGVESALCDITGTEDLLIDGSVEGLIRLDEWKLTVRTTARLSTSQARARSVGFRHHPDGF
jgi:hypothetical protein